MSVFRRAFLYIFRKPVRMILLFFLLSAMGLLMLSGLSIYNSASASADAVRRAVTSGFEVSFIPELYNGDIIDTYTNEKGELVRVLHVSALTPDGIDQILALDGVEGYYTTIGYHSLYTDLDVIPGHYTAALQEMKKEIVEDPDKALQYEQYFLAGETNSKSIRLLETDGTQWQPYFVNGAVELVKGRHLTADDERKAILSAELADRNHLAPGDTLTVYEYDFVSGEVYSDPYEMEIIGIFQPNFEEEISYYSVEDQILDNLIFTGREADSFFRREYAEFYGGQPVVNETEHYTKVLFYVDSPLNLDHVMEQVRNMDIVDWKYYMIEKSDEDYRNVAGPLQMVLNLSAALLAVTVAGAFAVIALLLTMWTRSRRTETGILLSIGIAKRQIILQLLLEGLIITAVSFLPAVLLAKPVTAAIGNTMIAVSAPEEDAQPYETKIVEGTYDLEITKTATETVPLDFTVNAGMLLVVFGSMLVVTAATILAASYCIMRRKPKELLLRR